MTAYLISEAVVGAGASPVKFAAALATDDNLDAMDADDLAHIIPDPSESFPRAPRGWLVISPDATL
jgi:hypothetical protein